jgi:hypothetical protein
MTHYTVHYTGTNAEIDARAIKDVVGYLGDERFQVLIEAFHDPERTIMSLNFLCGFAGIQDRPFFALARKYRLADFREWMHSGPDSIQTDESGYPVTDIHR